MQQLKQYIIDYKSLSKNIEEAENNLKKLLNSKQHLITKIIPDYMENEGIENVVIDDLIENKKVFVKIKDYTTCYIPSLTAIDKAYQSEKDLLIKKRENCLNYLKSSGAGFLIKNKVELFFNNSDETAQLLGLLGQNDYKYNVQSYVNPQSLSSHIKQALINDENLPNDFTIFHGKKVDIKEK